MQKITPEDGAIIARIQRGHTEAFDELVKRHKPRAYCYAMRLTKSPDEASDIVAEAFVRVFRSIDTFRGDSSFTTWLYRIETNCFLDMRKKASGRRHVSLDEVLGHRDDHSAAEIPDDGDNPFEYIEKGERISLINRVLIQLPKRHQAILIMYHAESMSYEEIAETLQMPLGTVKSRLNRARLHLRDALRPWKKLLTGPTGQMRPQMRS